MSVETAQRQPGLYAFKEQTSEILLLYRFLFFFSCKTQRIHILCEIFARNSATPKTISLFEAILWHFDSYVRHPSRFWNYLPAQGISSSPCPSLFSWVWHKVACHDADVSLLAIVCNSSEAAVRLKDKSCAIPATVAHCCRSCNKLVTCLTCKGINELEVVFMVPILISTNTVD